MVGKKSLISGKSYTFFLISNYELSMKWGIFAYDDEGQVPVIPYKLSATGTIGAHKAYLVGSASAPDFFLFSDATGISEIEKMRNVENETFYDLQGRRVAQPTKGLYIVNGKKVVIK